MYISDSPLEPFLISQRDPLSVLHVLLFEGNTRSDVKKKMYEEECSLYYYFQD